jgi:hypothetical protein
VGLDANLVEGFTECPYSQIGVLACHQVDLLKGSTIGFYSGETAHVDDDWRNAL